MKAASSEVDPGTSPNLTITMSWEEAQVIVKELGEGKGSTDAVYNLFYILDDIVNTGLESSESSGCGSHE